MGRKGRKIVKCTVKPGSRTDLEDRLSFVKSYVKALETLADRADAIAGAESIDDPDYNGHWIRIQHARTEWIMFQDACRAIRFVRGLPIRAHERALLNKDLGSRLTKGPRT